MKTMVRNLIVTGTLGLCLSAPFAFAQYTGPGGKPKAAANPSVADILRDPVDDQWVELSGKLLRQVSSDEYLFSDGTGEIRVEIDRKLFPRDTPVDESTEVVLIGEVDRRWPREAEIDVERLTIKTSPTP